MVIIPVAVEKVGVPETNQESSDRKCPGDCEKSFQSFLTRSNSCDFVAREFFNSHPCSRQLFGIRLVFDAGRHPRQPLNSLDLAGSNYSVGSKLGIQLGSAIGT
jgi:hypothetical protein